MFWNLPNSLTMARIILIPVFVGIFYAQPHYISQHAANVLATAIFGLAAITDWLDGYYARKLNLTSAFGAFLDPVADKLMVAAALIVLVEFNRVGALFAFIIIGFITMSGSSTVKDFNPDIFSFRRITVGPMISLFGFISIIFALLYKPKTK